VKGMNEVAFDHSTTGFELVGAHAEATCQSCHQAPARRDEDYRFTLVEGTPRQYVSVPGGGPAGFVHVVPSRRA
jgi:hypothetical protein